jgi:hypothetical protein
MSCHFTLRYCVIIFCVLKHWSIISVRGVQLRCLRFYLLRWTLSEFFVDISLLLYIQVHCYAGNMACHKRVHGMPLWFQGCTNPGSQVKLVTKFCKVAPNSCGSSLWGFSVSTFWFIEGHMVAQLVESLRYKPEGSRFDSRWCHWNFSLTQHFRPHYGLGVDSAFNRNE